MAQGKPAGAVQDIIRRRLSDIRTWQAARDSSRVIAERLGVAESSYRGALKAIEAEVQLNHQPANVNVRQPSSTNALAPQVHSGKPYPADEATQDLAVTVHTLAPVVHELSELLPGLREVYSMLPRLKTMVGRESERQALAQMPEEYEHFIATYSVRLAPKLIEAIKAYAKRHRLTQSEVITTAVYGLLSQDSATHN
jgi:hypothetical protein